MSLKGAMRRVTDRRRSLLAGAAYFALVVGGCSRKSDTVSPDPLPDGNGQVAVAATNIGPASSARAVFARPRALGFDAVPALPSDAAQKKNNLAVVALKNGAFAKARQLLEEVLAKAPDFLVARYNHACALSRVGAFEEATAELERLLSQDLPRFRAALEHDLDLAPLRNAVQGERLKQSIARLEQDWVAALGHGISAVMVYGDKSDSNATDSEQLRAGIYIHKWNRFIPMGPPMGGTLGLQVGHGRLLAITGAADHAGVPFLKSIVFRVLSLPFGPEEAKKELGSAALMIASVDVGLTEAGARYLAEPPLSKAGWFDLTLAGIKRSADQSPPAGPRLSITPDGSVLLVTPPVGFAVHRGRLSIPGAAEPLDLGSGHKGATHTSIVVSQDKKIAVVASIHVGCPEAEGVLHHVVDRVRLDSRAVDRLSEGQGAAAVAFGPDHALYLQVATALKRYDPPIASAGLHVMPGVMLTAPMRVPDCGM